MLIQQNTAQINFSNDDFIHLDREMAKRSLAEFVKMSWHIMEPATKLKWGWVMDVICEHLEAITYGTLTRHLVANVPPGSMKSLLVNVFWPAWEWGPAGMPYMRHTGTAHEEGLAIRDNRKARALVKSDFYQKRWPTQLDSSMDGKKEFGNINQGFMLARAFTSMTGRRADRVKLDDPISAFHANSPAHIEAARVAFLETLPTRVNNEESRIVVIMQRLNEMDVTGIILEKELDYEHLIIPMEYEADRVYPVSSLGWKDPRTEDGELMFPERFGQKQVDELKKTMGSYGVAGQLQQRPTPRGGGLFKEAWWGEYDELPKLKYRGIYADTAQKTKESSDYSVLQCWGVTYTGQAVLVDQVRGKWEAPDLLVETMKFWRKHKQMRGMGSLRYLKVEDKVSGTGLIQTLRRRGIPVLAIKRVVDKMTRAHDAAPLVESGNVLLPKNVGWVKGYIAEFGAFPNGANDDQVDPTMDALSDLIGPGHKAVGMLVKKRYR